MRKLGFAAAFVVLLALIGYAVGLGIYAVASTRPRFSTQPHTPEQARHALTRLGLAQAYPFASRFALTPHGRMHYVVEGSGENLLCLHGNGRWSLECAGVLRARSGKARVLAPDLIGFGLSEKPDRLAADPIAAHAEDLAALIAVLNLREVQLISSKSSAQVAIELARLSPERVRSTVIEDGERAPDGFAARFAGTPLLGELIAQGLGGLSPGFARSPYGRLQGNWYERSNSLALARATLR